LSRTATTIPGPVTAVRPARVRSRSRSAVNCLRLSRPSPVTRATSAVCSLRTATCCSRASRAASSRCSRYPRSSNRVDRIPMARLMLRSIRTWVVSSVAATRRTTARAARSAQRPRAWDVFRTGPLGEGEIGSACRRRRFSDTTQGFRRGPEAFRGGPPRSCPLRARCARVLPARSARDRRPARARHRSARRPPAPVAR